MSAALTPGHSMSSAFAADQAQAVLCMSATVPATRPCWTFVQLRHRQSQRPGLAFGRRNGRPIRLLCNCRCTCRACACCKAPRGRRTAGPRLGARCRAPGHAGRRGGRAGGRARPALPARWLRDGGRAGAGVCARRRRGAPTRPATCVARPSVKNIAVTGAASALLVHPAGACLFGRALSSNHNPIPCPRPGIRIFIRAGLVASGLAKCHAQPAPGGLERQLGRGVQAVHAHHAYQAAVRDPACARRAWKHCAAEQRAGAARHGHCKRLEPHLSTTRVGHFA